MSEVSLERFVKLEGRVDTLDDKVESLEKGAIASEKKWDAKYDKLLYWLMGIAATGFLTLLAVLLKG